ncbi:hypothetical protein [Cupriavidus sp. 8B]
MADTTFELCMRFGFCVFLMSPLMAMASPEVRCSLEQSDEEAVMSVRAEPDALGGSWQEMGRFKVRALLAAPPKKKPWLLVEVYAKAADGDYRIISSQKAFTPFATEHMEVVEPSGGRSLRYKCGAAQ